MRKLAFCLASALTTLLVLGGLCRAQDPVQRRDGPRGPEQRSPITVDDIVDWIMSFDKDKKGKVTKDDLPERMQYLIEKGDTNKDGALDRDEVRALAAKLEKEGFGRGGQIRTFGPAGVSGGVRFGLGGGSPGPGQEQMEGVLEDLKVDGKKKEQAKTAIKTHLESSRKLMEQSRLEFLQKMKDILSEEEFENFKAALDRPRGETFLNLDGPKGGPGPGELERKIEQLQKEVEELRRQQRR